MQNNHTAEQRPTREDSASLQERVLAVMREHNCHPNCCLTVTSILQENEPKPASIASLDKIQDYRFGSLTKSETYAFARGLTINPTHLPDALDAMTKDGWNLLAIFGETNAKEIGFIFKRETTFDWAKHDTLSQALTLALAARDQAVARSDELLCANNALVEQRRTAQARVRELEDQLNSFSCDPV